LTDDTDNDNVAYADDTDNDNAAYADDLDDDEFLDDADDFIFYFGNMTSVEDNDGSGFLIALIVIFPLMCICGGLAGCGILYQKRHKPQQNYNQQADVQTIKPTKVATVVAVVQVA